jgi:hypothetical protein
MQFWPWMGKAWQKVGWQTNHPFLATVRLTLTFLWAAVPILLILAAIYLVFKGNIR